MVFRALHKNICPKRGSDRSSKSKILFGLECVIDASRCSIRGCAKAMNSAFVMPRTTPRLQTAGRSGSERCKAFARLKVSSAKPNLTSFSRSARKRLRPWLGRMRGSRTASIRCMRSASLCCAREPPILKYLYREVRSIAAWSNARLFAKNSRRERIRPKRFPS